MKATFDFPPEENRDKRRHYRFLEYKLISRPKGVDVDDDDWDWEEFETAGDDEYAIARIRQWDASHPGREYWAAPYQIFTRWIPRKYDADGHYDYGGQWDYEEVGDAAGGFYWRDGEIVEDLRRFTD